MLCPFLSSYNKRGPDYSCISPQHPRLSHTIQSLCPDLEESPVQDDIYLQGLLETKNSPHLLPFGDRLTLHRISESYKNRIPSIHTLSDNRNHQRLSYTTCSRVSHSCIYIHRKSDLTPPKLHH